VIPTALLVLGFGAVVLAMWPGAAGRAVYVVVVWSAIVDFVAALVSGAHWISRLSVFDYAALAPAQAVDPRTVMITLAVAAALVGVAVGLFVRRDVNTG